MLADILWDAVIKTEENFVVSNMFNDRLTELVGRNGNIRRMLTRVHRIIDKLGTLTVKEDILSDFRKTVQVFISALEYEPAVVIVEKTKGSRRILPDSDSQEVQVETIIYKI